MNNIIKYIELNFEDGNEKVQEENLNKLLKKSAKLNKMLNFLIHTNNHNFIYEDEHINELFYEYINNVNNCELGSTYQEYIKRISAYKTLTKEEEYELAKKISEGDEAAKEEFIKANLKLVVKIAHHYYQNEDNFMDIIESGNEGLLKAVKGFDYTKGYRFSTYASKSINNTIINYLENESKIIKIPKYLYPIINKIKEYIIAYRNLYYEEPTSDIISKELSIDKNTVERLLSIQDILSLNELMNNENRIEEENLSDDSNNIDDIACNKDLISFICNTDILNEREKQILIYRYGLLDKNVRQLSYIANIYGVKRERIFQIEKKALKKLRRDSFIQSYFEKN